MADHGGGVSSSNVSNNQSVEALCSHINATVYLFFMLVYSLLFLVGLLLNGFTLKVYFCGAQLQASSSVTVYLRNLAAADFLISLCLLIRIANYASSSTLVHQVYCNFGASAFYLNMYASILFMGYIAANRYLKIVHPLGTHVLQTVRAARLISVLTWVFLLSVMSAYIILLLLTHQPLTSVPDTITCDILRSGTLSMFYKVLQGLLAVVFLCVLVALVFFYHSTSHRLSVAQRRQAASSGSRMLAKSRRNMLVLVSVFCVCFVPYHLVRLPQAFLWNRCSWSAPLFYLKEATVMLSVLNVCLDPLIYFIFCKAFRAQLNLGGRLTSRGGGRQSSDGRRSSIKTNRKTSLTSMTQRKSSWPLTVSETPANSQRVAALNTNTTP